MLLHHDSSYLHGHQHVDKVWLTSSLVNTDTKRLLGLLIEDVRFTKDYGTSPATPADPHQADSASTSTSSRIHHFERVLPILTSFVQVSKRNYET